MLDRLGFAVFFDPGIGAKAQEVLVIPIRAAPFSPFFFMVGMNHTNRAPGEFKFFFLLHSNLFSETGLAEGAQIQKTCPSLLSIVQDMCHFLKLPHIHGFHCS